EARDVDLVAVVLEHDEGRLLGASRGRALEGDDLAERAELDGLARARRERVLRLRLVPRDQRVLRVVDSAAAVGGVAEDVLGVDLADDELAAHRFGLTGVVGVDHDLVANLESVLAHLEPPADRVQPYY